METGEGAVSEPFDKPRLAINRVYTRQGDKGDTGLVGGQRVPKDGTRIEAYGTVDELNSFLGAARATVNQLSVEEPRLALLAAIILRVQHELFNLGSILATLPEDVHPRQPRIGRDRSWSIAVTGPRYSKSPSPSRKLTLSKTLCSSGQLLMAN